VSERHGINECLCDIGFESDPLSCGPIAHFNLKAIDAGISYIVNDFPEPIGSEAETPKIQRISTHT
jgi:hypothetical protein